MKRIYILAVLLLATLCSWAQSFTVTGPRTYYSDVTALNTTLYFNFDLGKYVASTDTWHMSLAATAGSSTIEFNTGVEAQILSDTTFEKTLMAPISGYTSTINNGLMGTNPGMFFYDLSGTVGTAHRITPRQGKLIVVKLADGRYVKLEMLSIYKYAPVNAHTTTATLVFGYYSFRYLVSSTTDIGQKITKIKNLLVPGSATYQMVNFALADTTVVITDRWTFRIQGRTVQPNSSAGYAAELLSTEFNALTAGTTITPASSIAWSRYNGPTGPGQDPLPHTHIVYTLPEKTILFKDSLGRYGKAVIESYYKDAPSVPCTQASRYYTISYYYNPYGDGETLTGRDGSTLATSATLNISVLPGLTISGTALTPSAEGLINPETITVTSNTDWTVSTGDSWIILGNSSGTANGSFTIDVDTNTGIERTGTVDIVFCNGAERTITITQVADASTTPIKIASEEKVKVYPNPASDKLSIDIATSSFNELVITSVDGRQMFYVASPSSMFDVNVQAWGKGVYFMKLTSNEGVSYRKIQVQ